MAKKKIPKQRNYVALAAWNRSGAGPHQDRRYSKKYRSQFMDDEDKDVDIDEGIESNPQSEDFASDTTTDKG
jgi:hypothetical protein